MSEISAQPVGMAENISQKTFQEDIPYSSDGDNERRHTEISAEYLITRAHMCTDYMQNAGEEICSLLTAMAAEVRQKDIELKTARRQIHKLENALSDSTRRLLKALPTSSLDDARFHDEYSTLRGSLEDWVWLLPNVTLSTICRSSLSQTRTCNGEPIDDEDTIGEALALLDSIPELQSEALSAIICRFMCQNIFEPCILGASVIERDFMSSLEMSMEQLRGDRESIDAWRSNTVRAHVKREGYEEKVRAEIREFSDYIRRFLLFVGMEQSYLSKAIDHLNERVLPPAAELAKEMRCAPESYHIKWYDSHEERGRLKRLLKRDLQKYSMIDKRTHHEVREDKLSDFRLNQRIARVLLVMSPAIFRLDNKVGKYLHIEKATLLVELDEAVSAQLSRRGQNQRDLRPSKQSEQSDGDRMDAAESFSREENVPIKSEDSGLGDFMDAL